MGKNKIFRIKPAIQIIGYILVTISFLLLFVLITKWEIDEPNEIYWVVGMFAFYLITGTYIVIQSLKYRITISEDKLIETYAFKKAVVFKWKDIDSINIRISNGLISIQGKSKKIKLTRSISDISEVFSTVLEKVGKEKITFDS